MVGGCQTTGSGTPQAAPSAQTAAARQAYVDAVATHCDAKTLTPSECLEQRARLQVVESGSRTAAEALLDHALKLENPSARAHLTLLAQQYLATLPR